MIILDMAGGLGNQMFFYALYARLKGLGREIAVDDVSEFAVSAAAGMPRKPLLEETFGITYRRAEKEELRELTGAGTGKLTRAYRKKIAKRPYLPLVHDKLLTFDEKILQMSDAHLQGYFQSPAYFSGMEDELSEAFTFRHDLLDAMPGWRSCAAMIGRATEPVSVHLRFGDYEELSEVYGGICTDEYYDRAIRAVKDAVECPRFFVFSNDTEKARKWIDARRERKLFKPGSAVLIEGSDETGARDMELMSRCRHHIIANSSFSWWGAYLSGLHEDRQSQEDVTRPLVFAPAQWIRSADGSGISGRDIYTENMCLISPAGTVVHVPEDERRVLRDEPLVSVIVAAYNIEDYLDRAMKSLTTQTYRNLEILLVDDGSTDSTRAICNTWGRRDERVRVIHKENGGLSDARNAALAVATGEYIGYLDGDDFIEPSMYETLVYGALTADAQVAVTRYREESDGQGGDMPAETARDNGGNAPGSARENLRHSLLLTRQQALEIYLSGDTRRATIYNSVWSKLYRRAVVKDLLFPAGRNSEDILYTTKAFRRMDRCIYVDVPLYHYVSDRSGSIMNEKKGARRLSDEIPFWKEQIAYLREEGLTKEADLAAYAFYRRMLFYDRDFRAEESMLAYAEKLEEMLSSEKDEIRHIYAGASVEKGDRMRMRLFLISPKLYDRWAGWYEEKIIPLRHRLRRSRADAE